LKGRKVVLWPDNDAPGDKAMRERADILKVEIDVTPDIVEVAAGLPEGWDIADEVPENFSIDFTLLVSRAQPFVPVSDVEIGRLNKDYAFIVSGGRPAVLYEKRNSFDGSVEVEHWSVDA